MPFSNYQIRFLLALLLLLSLDLNAQISEGGIPKSFGSAIVDEALVIQIELDKPSVEILVAEDIVRDADGLNLRDAVAVPVSFGLENSGIWFDQSDGSRIWRLKIFISEAYSLEPYFDEFSLPPGGELFLYNEDGTEIYGAYTHLNNSLHGRLSTEMVQGDVINFEYYEPASVFGEGELHLLDIGYRYRDIIGLDSTTEEGGAQICEVDVTCVEGQVWQNQSASTVRIRTRINGQFFWCTGTVMNNTAQDCRPLILTSLRCALDGNDMSGVNDFDYYRFYFGYQAEGCNAGGSPNASTLSGCTKLGDSNDNGGGIGSDYLMLELNDNIPSEYNAYYAGWNATGVLQSGLGVSIHHASGDVKKISTYINMPTNGAWGIPGTHWRVFWSETVSGHGVMEQGSYGCGLFDSNGYLIGTLTGGASECEEVVPGGENLADFFGKMSYHWSDNPNPMSEKLRTILDPLGNNTVVFDGESAPCVTGLLEQGSNDFSISPNPANDHISIVLDTPHEVERISIVDLSGKIIEVRDNNRTGSFLIDTSNLAPGMYLVNIQDDTGVLRAKRFIVGRN